MRKAFEVQLELGAVPIEQVKIPFNSRDELPPTLQALQWVFTTPELNQEVFSLLEKTIIEPRKATGRPGMDLWQILVLGVVRLTLNINYDRLHYVANFDSLVRELLGVPAFCTQTEFKLSTLKENLPLLSEKLLDEINIIIAKHGSTLIKKKRNAPPKSRQLRL